MKRQGFSPGSCQVEAEGTRLPACQATLREEGDRIRRLISTIHLSRPENYLSIYQSGCNFSCRKCHSWSISKVKSGTWLGPEDILKYACDYEEIVNLKEPREKATAWHASESCRCCGRCVTHAVRSSGCPGILPTESVLWSPQGFGPARNIVGFTGGDLTCCTRFYEACARLIKEKTDLWVLIETNGFGLTPGNLDQLMASGVDAFWLDIKAHDPEHHRWLTGCSNDRILALPEEILKRGFILEVLSLYIPGLVESQELGRIARLLAAVDTRIPFTILAFFPEYRMKDFRSPTVQEMVQAYEEARSAGLRRIRLGNRGVFVQTAEEQEFLLTHVEREAF
jgi:pyruvate-formate lyase-activating enzyme